MKNPFVPTQLPHFRKQRIRPVRRARILGLLEGYPCGRVLDAPAGSLWLAQALSSRGFSVDAIDLHSQRDRFDPEPGTVRYRRGDLGEGLTQFADRTFDYVVSVEGLEHLERPALTLREFGRVLKPCGLLLLTTPNVVSLRSRIKFPLFGYYDGVSPARAVPASRGLLAGRDTARDAPSSAVSLLLAYEGRLRVHPSARH